MAILTASSPFAAVAALLLSANVGSAWVPIYGTRIGGAASTSSSALSMSAALIVQNKGGGHGELGFQLARALRASNGDKITSVTILQDDACDESKEPFVSYGSDLPDVTVVRTALGDEGATAESLQAVLGDGASFEYIWDNASKGPVGAGKAVCDLAKVWDTKLLTYVSSAGMYQPAADATFPMSEMTPIKESAGQAKFDAYAIDLGLPLVSFRPQYIYGPKSSKNDYIDWYLDRIVRDLPLPIPGDGTQKVSLTNSEDVASLLSSVLKDEGSATGQRFFNCGTDYLVSYDDVAYMCAEAAGVAKEDVKIQHYDSDKLGKGKFPFRPTDFYVSPDAAKSKLGWEGATHKLSEDLGWYFEGYKARGGPEKKLDLSKDWEIISGSESEFAIGSVYEKYDPALKELQVD